MDFSEIMAAARQREETVSLCLDGTLNAEHEALSDALEEARRGVDTTSLGEPVRGFAIAQQIVDLETRMTEATKTFKVRALGHKAWSDLLASHPPEDPDVSAFNLKTFPPALIAACSLDPIMSDDQVTELFEVLNLGQRNLLFGAAWRANQGVDIPFSQAASETLQSSGARSKSPVPGVSPDRSSSVE